MESARSNAFPPPSTPHTVPAPAAAPVDALMQERLARLSANRAGRGAGGAGIRPLPSAKGTRKRHAAKGSRAAAVLMSVAATAGLAAYFQRVDSAAASQAASTLTGAATAATPAASGSTTATTAVTTAATTATTTGAKTAAPATTAVTPSTTTATTAAGTGLAEGTYTGATATNKWGPVQVQITVTGGKITQAVALQTPSDDRKSVSINARATPTLAAEVLSAQSAKIDTVSGATYTSTSYKASLQSAIDLSQATAAQAGATS